MKTFYVICEELCPSCNGEGAIFVVVNESDAIAHQEIPCRSCDSTGVIRTYNIPLSEALKSLANEKGKSND